MLGGNLAPSQPVAGKKQIPTMSQHTVMLSPAVSAPLASQTITFTTLANATYGDAVITLTGTASSNLAVTYTSSNTAVATVSGSTVTIVGAGTTTITASQAGNSNYLAATSIPQTLIVKPRAVSVTGAAQTKVYGTTDPVLTYSITTGSLVGSDTFTGTLTRKTGQNPGTYPITQGTLALNSNYSLTYVNGSLTITPLSICNLFNLSFSSGTLSPVFNTTAMNYKLSVTFDVDHVFFVPLFDPTASILINGFSIGNGGAFNIPLNAGNNPVTLVVTAQDGVSKKTYFVNVYRAFPPDPKMATNILTPNGDGKNDTWVIRDINLYPNNTVTVYDRGGRVVYAKHGYNNDWDGTLYGATLAEGTYYYTIDLGIPWNVTKGYITILKSN